MRIRRRYLSEFCNIFVFVWMRISSFLNVVFEKKINEILKLVGVCFFRFCLFVSVFFLFREFLFGIEVCGFGG